MAIFTPPWINCNKLLCFVFLILTDFTPPWINCNRLQCIITINTLLIFICLCSILPVLNIRP